jgi:hypothetical protein
MAAVYGGRRDHEQNSAIMKDAALQETMFDRLRVRTHNQSFYLFR